MLNFEASHNLTDVPYNSVHLRSIGGSGPFGSGCGAPEDPADLRNHQNAQAITPTDMGGRAVTRWDVCMMSDAYLEAAFRSAGTTGRPLVLTHDPAAEARAKEIVSRWDAVRYRGPNGLNVDMQLLIR